MKITLREIIKENEYLEKCIAEKIKRNEKNIKKQQTIIGVKISFILELLMLLIVSYNKKQGKLSVCVFSHFILSKC